MRSTFVRLCSCGLALAAVAALYGQNLLAATATVDVPEINPGTISLGLGVLAAGVLILTSRRRSR